MGKATKPRKPKADPVQKLASSILPPEQVRHGLYAIRDIANHSDADQRAMVRSGSTRTVRRKTRVEMMREAQIITPEQAAACEWMAAAHEIGFHTVGCTANYNGAGGGELGSSDLLARYKDQAEARQNYYYAKQAIPSHLLGLFEGVVLGSKELTSKEDKLRFSIAAFKLYDQIYHLLAV